MRNENLNAIVMSKSLREIVASPWWLAALAVGELILGFILLGFPLLLGASAIWLGGFLFIGAGILRLIQLVQQKEGRLWNLGTAMLYFLIAAVMLLQTAWALSFWTLILGILMVVIGCMRFVISLGMRGSAGSVWRFTSAFVAFGLGCLVCFTWPESSMWFVGTLIAVEMIFSGWTMLFLVMAPKEPATL